MTPFRYTFTVFTPTYNRAHTLHRVYESLQRQTFRDFEWLIVDDGSTDATRARVERWQEEADFPIRYLFQENQGKHIAFNRGVREAEGELFLNIDSDDEYVATALERFKHHWDSIPAERRVEFTGVTGLCVDVEGKVVGTPFPHDVTDSDSLEVVYRYKVTGEKGGFHRTEVLRQFPHHEGSAGQIIPDGLLWTRIARKYKTRFINEVVRVYYTDQAGWSRGVVPQKLALGSVISYREALNDHLHYFRYSPMQFCRAAAHYVRFSLHLGTQPIDQLAAVDNKLAKFLCVVALPVGFGAYFRDRWFSRPSV